VIFGKSNKTRRKRKRINASMAVILPIIGMFSLRNEKKITFFANFLENAKSTQVLA